MQPQEPTLPTQPAGPNPPVQAPQPPAPPAAAYQPEMQPAPIGTQAPAPPQVPLPGAPVSQTPLGAPQPMPSFEPQMPGAGGRKKKILIACLALAVIIAIAAAVTYLASNLMASIKLTDYSSSLYSLKVPAEYEKKPNGTSINFEERASGVTQSKVIVYYSGFADPISNEQVKTVRETFKKQLATSVEDLAKQGDQQLKNLKVRDDKFKGNDALWLEADVTENNQAIGTVKLVSVVDTKRLYMVGVAAHDSDKGLLKKADTIIDSFSLK